MIECPNCHCRLCGNCGRRVHLDVNKCPFCSGFIIQPAKAIQKTQEKPKRKRIPYINIPTTKGNQ